MPQETITDSGTTERVFNPPASFSQRAHIKSMDEYKRLYERSIKDPEGFWGEIANGFYWKQKWTKVREYEWQDKISIKWFIGAKTNITYNCLDRHLDKTRQPGGPHLGRQRAGRGSQTDLQAASR